MEAAARKLPRGALGHGCPNNREGYAGKRPAKHFRGLKFEGFEGWQTAGLNALTTEAMSRQTAGCNAGTAGAYGYRAWWKLPRGSCREAPSAWTP